MMQTLLAHLQEQGYSAPEPELYPDGKIHRFKRQPSDKSKDAWYVCYMFTSSGGYLYYNIIFHDWRESGEALKFNTLKGASKYDLSAIADQIEKAKKERDLEEIRVWEETSNICSQAWASFSHDGVSPYLARKKVKAYGVRYDGHSETQTIIVPVTDLEGKIWSLQYISDTKRFHPKGKVKGNFFVIGTIDKEALLCEGYATGASLHEATGLPVIVAFSASNMPEVAAKFTGIRVTVCAELSYVEDNVSKKYADKCAASKVIYPKFSDATSKPTDFNDLHVLEGLTIVRNQILGDKTPRQFVLALGHREDDYYYTSSSNRQIVRIARGQHSKAILLDLMPMSYWEARYPGTTGPNFTTAQDQLMMQARAKGIYDEENIRGIGVWKDNGRYLVNLGDGLFTNEKIQVDDFETNYIYEIGKRIKEPTHTEPDITLLPTLMDKISFKQRDSKIYFLGFLTVAPVAGALNWRPHIWLNGGSNTGKSTIMQVVSQVFGGFKHYFQGQTTEAGIRQTTRNDSKAVMFDEFEADDERGKERLSLVLELVRQASSETDGHVAKGSPGGNAVTARPKFSAMFSSIRIPSLNEADKTRITDIELERTSNAEMFDEFKALAAQITPEYANAYLSRTVRLLPVLQANVDIFWDVLRRKHSARIGQQYGALMAGAWLARFDAPVTREEAELACAALTLDDAKQTLANKDEMECLDHLSTCVVPVAGGMKYSIRELVEKDNVASMGHYGILKTDDKLYVANNNPELKKLFKDTRWAAGWGKSLARLEGATKGTKYIAGKSVYSVGFSLDLVLEKES